MRKIIGIGESVLDILFRDGQPVAAVPGGSVFNAMVSLGRCGAQAEIISIVGDDRIGTITTDFLRQNGVGTDCVQVTHGQQSPLSLAFLDEHNDADYLFYRDSKTGQPFVPYPSPLPDIHADDIVLIGSFYAVDPARREQVGTLLEKARQAGAIIYYDVNFRPSHQGDVLRIQPNLMENYEYADIVRASTDDFSVLYAQTDVSEVFRSKVSFYCDNLVATDGPRPVRVLTRSGVDKDYAVATDRPPVSTVGAGDNFNAGLIFALLRQNITRSMIANGLSEGQWDALVAMGQRFAAESCRDIYNYVSEDFARHIQGRQLF